MNPDDGFDDRDLGPRLRSLLEPDLDLADRTTAELGRALQGKSVLATGFDLLGLGLWTARTVLSDTALPADEDREGT